VKNSTDSNPDFALRPTFVRYFVLAALCLITTINYIQRNSLGGAETTVRADLHLRMEDTGQAMGAFFLTYALCQVPSGWLADRWGGRRALTVFAASWSVVMALTALARSGGELTAARGAMGVLQAGIFPCCTMILALWYPSTQRGFATAMLNSCMVLGSVFAPWLTARLIGPLGWRWLFFVYALPGLAWAAWFAVWFRDRPRQHGGVNPAELALIEPSSPQADAIAAKPSAPVSWKILLSWTLFLICVQQFCRAGALRFFDQWLPTYLQEGRGLSKEDANQWTSYLAWAGVIGGPIGGILSDWVLARSGSRRLARQGVAIASLLICLFVYALAYRIADVGGAVRVAALGLGIMTFSAPIAYALTMDMGERRLGLIFATMNMAGNLGAWAFTSYIPLVVRWRGWDAALFVFAGMHVVAVVCWVAINPNGVIGEAARTEAKS
jgi:sugar phosphate permease